MMMPSPHIEYQQHEHIYPQIHVSNGKRLIVVGEASSGPYYEPIYIHNLSIAQMYFGSGPLIDRYMDVTLFDSDIDVYLMRINQNAFQIAMEHLKTYEFDLIYFDNFQFGKSLEDVLAFIDFAHEKEQQGLLIHGFFDVMSISQFSELEPVFEMIRSFTFDTLFHTEEEGKYISIVMDQFQDRKAGAVYAGMIASLEPGVSPVNKKVDVILKQEFTKEEILKLREKGIVCFRNSIKNGVVCASSTCAVSTPRSVHKHIANFRIAQMIILDVTHALQQFVGRTGIHYHVTEIQDLLITIFNEHKNNNKIREYGFSILSAKLEGTLYVDIEIVPIFSIEKITGHAQVRVLR
jgi:hypothetical protein